MIWAWTKSPTPTLKRTPMPYIAKITTEKARKLNNTPSIYGTFAEIGAGQEVVNHFFKAGKASQTVAKSMSAYDMTFSDEIYGKAGRYVSEQRLETMLDHEYTLLKKRLKHKKGHNTKFFAFADTVAVSTTDRLNESHHHGWMGIRFQNEYNSSYNEMVMHINLLDKTRLQQHEILGALGVNLIHSAFYGKKDCPNIIKSLFDNFESTRVDMDVLRCSGKIFKPIRPHHINMELIRQKSTSALLFQEEGTSLLTSDVLYEKPILIHRLAPHNRLEDLKKAQSYIKNSSKKNQHLMTLLDIPFSSLKNKNIFHYLKKYKPGPKNTYQYILLSDFEKLFELKDFIRKATDQNVFLLLNPGNLSRLSQYRGEGSGDTLSFFSRLCDPKTTLLLPGESRTKSSHSFSALESYLRQTRRLVYLK